ncbi:MAG: BolA/IbaG family iron-sulfur metabolism protein [Gammaproteobacteria bacterium]|nr:BolA/IbaG family iron-sulfur metabolism protein [Gammaproteobacteria bacterium]
MNPEEIKNILQDTFPSCDIEVEEQQGKYSVLVIGEEFGGLNEVERQKKIYAPLTPYITAGRIHAVTVKGCTEKERNPSPNEDLRDN